MAKKPKTIFVCQECGYESPTWMGQCICGAWNSFVEEKEITPVKEDNRRRTIDGGKPVKLKEVGTREYSRIDTGEAGLHRRCCRYGNGKACGGRKGKGIWDSSD